MLIFPTNCICMLLYSKRSDFFFFLYIVFYSFYVDKIVLSRAEMFKKFTRVSLQIVRSSDKRKRLDENRKNNGI